MLRSLYTSGTAMMTLSNRLDVVANNLSNAGTDGFKRDLLVSRSFRDMLVDRVNESSSAGTGPRVGPLSLGIHVDQVFTSFEQGAVEETGDPLDISLRGPGFLAAGTAGGGEVYTRGGTLVVNDAGYLATSGGNILMGSRGPLHVGNSKLSIDKGGAVYADGKYVDTLRMINFTDQGLGDLRKTGDGLYTYTGPAGEMVNFDGEVVQGSLESSNVNVVKEMMDMMEVTRSYESNQRVVRMLDESLGKAVNDIARV